MSRFRLAAAAAAVLLLAGCSSTVPEESPAPTAESGSATATATATGVENGATSSEVRQTDFEMIDPWVKAAADGAMMTGAFGTFVNNSTEDVHVIAVTSPVTPRAELHEMVDQGGTPVMAEMPDGFTVAAGQSFVLEPGGNHFMLMDLMTPIEAGEEVEFSIEFADGRTFSWIAPVRTYDGANERYQEQDGSMGSGGGNRGGTETDGAEPSASPTN